MFPQSRMPGHHLLEGLVPHSVQLIVNTSSTGDGSILFVPICVNHCTSHGIDTRCLSRNICLVASTARRSCRIAHPRVCLPTCMHASNGPKFHRGKRLPGWPAPKECSTTARRHPWRAVACRGRKDLAVPSIVDNNGKHTGHAWVALTGTERPIETSGAPQSPGAHRRHAANSARFHRSPTARNQKDPAARRFRGTKTATMDRAEPGAVVGARRRSLRLSEATAREGSFIRGPDPPLPATTPAIKLPDSHIRVHSVLQTSRSRSRSAHFASPRLKAATPKRLGHPVTRDKPRSIHGATRGGKQRRSADPSGASPSGRAHTSAAPEQLVGKGPVSRRRRTASQVARKALNVFSAAAPQVLRRSHRNARVASLLAPDSPAATAASADENAKPTGTFLFTPPHGDGRRNSRVFAERRAQDGATVRAGSKRGSFALAERGSLQGVEPGQAGRFAPLQTADDIIMRPGKKHAAGPARDGDMTHNSHDDFEEGTSATEQRKGARRTTWHNVLLSDGRWARLAEGPPHRHGTLLRNVARLPAGWKRVTSLGLPCNRRQALARHTRARVSPLSPAGTTRCRSPTGR